MKWHLAIGLSLGSIVAGSQLCADQPKNDRPLETLVAAVPTAAMAMDDRVARTVQELVPQVERWAYDASFYNADSKDEQLLAAVDILITAKARVDQLLAETRSLRTQFVTAAAGAERRAAIRHFLATTAAITDLSGRLRYLSYDMIGDAAYDLAPNAASLNQLVDLLIDHNSSIGAAVMAGFLFDPLDPDEPRASSELNSKILKLVRVTAQHDLIPQLAQLVRLPGLSPQLRIEAAATIRVVGLPQDARPGRDKSLPAPPITAAQLYRIVSAVDASQLKSPWSETRAELLEWLDRRRREGIASDHYALGHMKLQAGDWLLMRNPSPYNLFTDLSPGLFTHVGVVAVRRDDDGIRRFLIVDLPERGSFIPAVTIDTFVLRTLDYVFLRHVDPRAADNMAGAAEAVIGNDSEFDLNFRIDGIQQLKGKPLKGKLVRGYCAGLLLLCAQESSRPRSEFFPIPEHPAGGKTLDNLAKLDVSMPHDFLSPTGALFSPHLKIVGRREPMYSPQRQIEQAVYDHFAKQMRDGNLTPAPGWFHWLRLNLAETAQNNPPLARALADAAGVNRNMDLVAAAKLGAVVETLDEFAYGASRQFTEARDAFRVGPVDDPKGADPMGDPQRQKVAQAIQRYRQRHAQLYELWQAEKLSPRQLRIELVDFYTKAGKKRLDERLFQKSRPVAAPHRDPK